MQIARRLPTRTPPHRSLPIMAVSKDLCGSKCSNSVRDPVSMYKCDSNASICDARSCAAPPTCECAHIGASKLPALRSSQRLIRPPPTFHTRKAKTRGTPLPLPRSRVAPYAHIAMHPEGHQQTLIRRLNGRKEGRKEGRKAGGSIDTNGTRRRIRQSARARASGCTQLPSRQAIEFPRRSDAAPRVARLDRTGQTRQDKDTTTTRRKRIGQEHNHARCAHGGHEDSRL